MVTNRFSEPVLAGKDSMATSERPGWMRPLPPEYRDHRFNPAEMTRGPLAEEAEPEWPLAATRPLLIDRLEEVLGSHAPNEDQVWEELSDSSVPYMQQLDLERLAKIEQRRRLFRTQANAAIRYYPVDDERRVALHNERDHGAIGTLTAIEWVAIKRAWSHRCAYCECELRRPVIEHVRPICIGGKTSASNIVPACWDCNRSKGTKEVEPWMGSGFTAFRQRWARAKSRARRWLRDRAAKRKPC
ncbi:hnhc [Caudoviricetes sp.]|nr:hnhc [Caudoviricetes sp.]